MNVRPYLFFDGRCEEALEFYRKAIGAKIGMMMRFKDSPEQCAQPVPEDKVMHAEFSVGDTHIMASDGDCKGELKPQGFALALSAPTPAEAERLFNALSDGGQVLMPMNETFYAHKFGMATDRFGVMWMVLAEKQPATSPSRETAGAR